MGNKEIHIIPMPLLLVLFLQKYQFSFINVTTAELIEDILTIAKAKLYNLSGVNDLEEVYTTLGSTRMIIDVNVQYEIASMVDIVTNDILSTLVLHNIHSRLFYVVKITPKAICLQTYDDHIHSPEYTLMNNKGLNQ